MAMHGEMPFIHSFVMAQKSMQNPAVGDMVAAAKPTVDKVSGGTNLQLKYDNK
jgi:hypothetical protein